jgi:hypothetical protein
MRKRAIKCGTAIVLVHLLVNIIHGTAHLKLRIWLRPGVLLFVIAIILICPLVAMVLLWASQPRFGFLLLALSMGSSLIFGLYKQFVAMGADQVGKQASGFWGICICRDRLPAISY